MIKLMILGRRAPGISRKVAHHHLREVHGRLVLLPPHDAGPMPTDYVQNHIIDGAYPGNGAHGIERDLFTEIWFDDLAALQASTATAYYLANLKPDEPRFVDDATVVRMLVRTEQLVARGSGQTKAFLILSLIDPGSAAATACIAELAGQFGSSPGLVALVVNHVLPPPDNRPRFADIVYECWFADETHARLAVESMASLLAAQPDGSIAVDRSIAVLAEEYSSARLTRHFQGLR